MMEEVGHRPSVEYIAPPLPPKTRQGTSTFTQITSEEMYDRAVDRGSMHPLVLNSKSTVFLAASERADAAPAGSGRHVVTIRINTDAEKSKPKISSVHLKSEAEFDPFKIEKKSSLVRLNVDDNLPKIVEQDELRSEDKPPYIYCNAFPLNSMTNMVMSSGQCSPSDTLDSGTCSDLDSTPPPPLPKKKTSKNASKKVSVTLISSANGSVDETDFADNDSNISCDSLNSSELNGDSHSEVSKEEKKQDEKTSENDDSFLPRGLLQDIRDRSTKLHTVETESEEEASLNVNVNANLSKESAELTSFRLVTKFNNSDSGLANSKSLISESTYEERKRADEMKTKSVLYSGNSFDSDKYYDFHLNEKQFDESAKSVEVKSDVEVEFFAGVKDFKSEEPPSTIRSSKGTIRGVKNRVRAGIATFLQIQSTTKSYKEKDANKVVIYTTTMGIVRNTYQRCVLVKKILRNLLVKYEDRDVFMSTEYQDEIRERMKSDQIMVPQLFVDGHYVGDADMVEKLNESGELRKMLKPYKSLDACNTCQMCGGFRLLPCRICNGSKKSLHRNHFTAEFVALKCMNCDEVGLVKCEVCC